MVRSRPRVSVVVVAYRNAGELAAGLPPLIRELDSEDQLIVIDNAPDAATAETVLRAAPRALYVPSAVNLGFAGGCNAGAERATGDILLLLNPDAVVQPGFGDAIRRPYTREDGWDAWMGLVTAEGGARINTSGNVVHFTGIAWAGGAGRDAASAPAAPREVAYLSGACLAIRRSVWERLGGFDPWFFLYHEDLDLSLRIRLAGGRVGIEPGARVDHAYEFHKGPYKWRLMERNRWAVLVRTYPASLLVLLAPALLATELAVLAAAHKGGWRPAKVAAVREAVTALPALRRQRRAIAATRSITASEFARALTPELSSPFLGGVARSGLVTRLLRLYWAVVVRAVGSTER